jgi:hypothetical protein
MFPIIRSSISGTWVGAAATDWPAALDADWTTLVTDFGALF